MLSKDIATEVWERVVQIYVIPRYCYVGGEKRTALEQYLFYGSIA